MAEHLAPEGKLDLAAVSTLHASLIAKSDRDIVLDLGKVSQIGALCVQTCIAAARQAKAAGYNFDIINTSDLVSSQISNMGLTPKMMAEGHI